MNGVPRTPQSPPAWLANDLVIPDLDPVGAAWRGLDPWHLVPVVLLAAAEGIFAWLVSASVLTDAVRWGVVVPMVGVMTLAAVAPDGLAALDLWPPRARVVTAFAVIVTAAVAMKAIAFPGERWLGREWVDGAAQALLGRGEATVTAWATILFVAAAWWRGGQRAEPTVDGTLASLRLAAAGLLVVLLGRALAGTEAGDGAMVGAVVAIVAGLLGAIATLRLAAERIDARAPDGVAPGVVVASGGGWAAPIAIAAVAAVAVVAATILTGTVWDAVRQAWLPIGWALTVLVQATVLIVVGTVFLLSLPILWLVDLLIPGNPGSQVVNPSAPAVPDAARAVSERSADLPDPIRAVLALAILALLVAAAIRFRTRVPALPVQTAGEDRERVSGMADLLANLRRAIAARLGRDGRPDGLAGLRGDPRWRHTLVIRLAYREWLGVTAAAGIGRQAWETPVRHGQRVATRLPERSRDDLDTMVTTYHAARYRPGPASAAEAARATGAWSRLRPLLPVVER